MYLLFYSNNCIFSLNILQLINNENLDDKFIKIQVDDPINHDKIKDITKVPTIITKEIQTPLVGKAAFEWIKNKKYFNQTTNNIKYAINILNPDIKSDIDKLAYNINDTNKITDRYTDINDKNDKIIDNQNNLLTYNKLLDNVPITNNNNIKFNISENKIGNKLDSQIKKYIEVRNTMNHYNNNNNISSTNLNN